jgi:uncharacterized DUF497 family protein
VLAAWVLSKLIEVGPWPVSHLSSALPIPSHGLSSSAFFLGFIGFRLLLLEILGKCFCPEDSLTELANCKTMCYTIDMRFLWNPEKYEENLKKHKVSFETAAYVFDDPNLIKIYDSEHSINEERWDIIGMTRDLLLFVVETEIDDDTIVIISARKANKQEEDLYNEANGNL